MARNQNLLTVSYNNEEEVEPDYLSTLPLGYRFCPTDSEIIVNYLKPKIETGKKHTEWRLYEVNFYDHHPNELAEVYWPFENKWYFFTPRTRTTPNGDRPNRRTKDFGYWRAQNDSTVRDDASGLEVGKKRSLVYYDASNKKSQWLMHEYTTINPNIPVGSIEDKMKLTHWVLCEIYKKKKKKKKDDSEQEVLSASNQHFEDLSRRQRILMHHQGSSYQVSALTHVFQQEVQSTYQDNESVESNEDDFVFTEEELWELLNDDYADSLKPGYRFCPTDSEIIVYYLQPKIETGEQHPKCRYYTADFYGDTPDNLAANHRHCENKWYFLTPRDRKYPNGTRPNRRIKNFGFWKASTKDREICDDVTGEIVGRRRNLAYYDKYSRKTPWLMHEYINNNPNIPIGSRIDEMMKLNNFVLCKIYKKKKKGDRNMANEDEGNEEQNLSNDEPSPRRRRLNPGSNLPNEPQHVWIQEENHHLLASLQPTNSYQQEVNIDTEESLTALTEPAQPFTAQTLSANQDIGSNDDAMTGQTRMNTGHYSITNNTISTQPQLVNPHAMTEREMTQSLCGSLACDDQQNQSILIALDEFLNGASSSTEMEAEQLPDYMIDTIQFSVTSTNGPPNSTADQVPQPDEDFFESNLTDEFPQLFNFSPDDQAPEPTNNDATTPLYDEDFFDCSRADEFPQLEDSEAILDEDLSNFNPMEMISFEDGELTWVGAQPLKYNEENVKLSCG